MNTHQDPSSRIDQKIFNSGLSVETISLYLLSCGLLDAGIPPTEETLRERWNASEEGFEKSLFELLEANILHRRTTDAEGQLEFHPLAHHHWRL